MRLMTLATDSSPVHGFKPKCFFQMPMSLDGRCSPDPDVLYFPLSRPMFQTSGLQWLAGNSHDLGRPPFPAFPAFPALSTSPPRNHASCSSTVTVDV
jgi:hypothetical protein